MMRKAEKQYRPAVPMSTVRAAKKLYDDILAVIANAQDEALTLGWEAFQNWRLTDAAVQGLNLAEARKQFSFSDMGDGDRMVYWKPTNEAIMFLGAPKVDTTEPLKPKGTVGYRLPTWAERQEMSQARAGQTP